MPELTPRERIARILRREPVDRIGLYEHTWPETPRKWRSEGRVAEGESVGDHFGWDMRECWAFDLTADLDAEEQVIEENTESRLTKDGNFATLRRWKDRSGTPEHVDFDVKDRAAWEELIRPRLLDESQYERRINFEGYRNAKRHCEENDLFFVWAGTPPFERMHPVAGHEYMLMGMATDPDWVRDMCDVYARVTRDLLDILFEREGSPDGMWYYEDMGFKGKPFMSPGMYRDIVQPSHAMLFGHAHARDLPVIVHSCGFVEPFVPGLIEAGMDCLQAIEVKAGMDLVKLKQDFGDRIAFCGGMDIRTLETNDPATVRAELEAKLPAAMEGSGYILHTDHSIPQSVEYETYKYFVETALAMGTY